MLPTLNGKHYYAYQTERPVKCKKPCSFIRELIKLKRRSITRFRIGSFDSNHLSAFRRYAVLIFWVCFYIFILWNVYAVNTDNTVLSNLLKANQNIKGDLMKVKNRSPTAESDKFNYDDVECYKFAYNNDTAIQFLDDFMDAARKPINGNSIFFTETSCAGNGIVQLHPRWVF